MRETGLMSKPRGREEGGRDRGRRRIYAIRSERCRASLTPPVSTLSVCTWESAQIHLPNRPREGKGGREDEGRKKKTSAIQVRSTNYYVVG